MLDNIVMSKLFRPGSVAYVSKSGGMSNELVSLLHVNTSSWCKSSSLIDSCCHLFFNLLGLIFVVGN
jgi:hypothetical protein